MAERTLLIMKPDLIADPIATVSVLKSFFLGGFVDLVAMRVLAPMSRAEAEALYVEHVGKPYYAANIDFMTSGPSVALIIADGPIIPNVVEATRKMIGATNPKEAARGTIRHQYGTELPRNAIHASANVADAEREIAIFFPGSK